MRTVATRRTLFPTHKGMSLWRARARGASTSQKTLAATMTPPSLAGVWSREHTSFACKTYLLSRSYLAEAVRLRSALGSMPAMPPQELASAIRNEIPITN